MIYFRADSSSQIGMGHLMRCLSVAKKLKEMTDVSFLCAYEACADYVEAEELNVVRLDDEAFSMKEAESIKKIVSGKDLLVLDSYLFNDDYVKELSKSVPVVIFDDMAKDAFSSSALINYNTYADFDEYISLYGAKGIKAPELILGGDYVPLRDEFSNIDHEFESSVKNILITTGGGDSENLGGEIAERLLSVSDNDIQIHLICGSFNPNYEKLLKLQEKNPNLKVHRAVKDMAGLMRECQLAVSAGGSTCYELCASKVPFVVFSYAENQMKLAENMQDKGVAVLAGHIRDAKTRSEVMDEIIKDVLNLTADNDLRKNLFEKGRVLVDGKGSGRLADKLEKIMEGKK